MFTNVLIFVVGKVGETIYINILMREIHSDVVFIANYYGLFA